MTTVYIVCGSPGAGKTTHGKKLAAERDAVFLDIDVSTERLVRLALRQSGRDPDDREQHPFQADPSGRPYTSSCLTSPGTTSPLTAWSSPALSRWKSRIAAGRRNSPAILVPRVEIHYVFCTPNVRRKRLLLRANSRDKSKIENWDSYVKYYGNETPPCFEHIYN